jgi:RNA polymerase sigma-70 factor (ECF subfamily)
MDQLSENQLVDRVTRGDQGALGELLTRYQHRLYNVVYRMVNHRDDAAELTQDALVKVVQHIRDYNQRCALSTWMIRIAMNLAISHLRKRKHRQHLSLDSVKVNPNGQDELSPLREQIRDQAEPGPDRSVQQEEMLRHLHQAMERLDEEFKAVLVLRDIEQMDYEQIAHALTLPIGTVKSRLFRARLSLRHEMLKLDPPAPRPRVAVAPNTGA